MASIWDYLTGDKTATTREQLFTDFVAPQKDEEVYQERIVTPTPAGPVTSAEFTPQEPIVKKFYKDDKGNVLSEEEATKQGLEIDLLNPTRVEVPNPKRDLSKQEVQEAISDFYAGKEAATGGEYLDLQSPMAELVRGQQAAIEQAKQPSALQKKFEEMGLEYDYTKRAERGSVLSESKFLETEPERKAKEQQKQALNQQLDAQLAKINQQAEIINNRQKFNEVKANRDKSLKSIEKSIMAVSTNKATAGTNFGKMKLQNLYTMQQDVLNQSNADMERLGGMGYEKMDSDSKLVYSRLAQNPLLSPEDRLSYVNNNYAIKQTSQNLLLNTPEDKRNQVDEYLFGKKKVENGQVQYDQDNEPIRVTKGIAFKNQFGVYEPSVDMNIYESKLKDVGQQFSEVTPQETEQVNVEEVEKKLSKDINNLQEQIKSLPETNYRSPEEEEEVKNLQSILNSLLKQRTNIIVQRYKPAPTFERQTNEPFIGEQETDMTTEVAPATPATQTTPTITTPTQPVTGGNINALLQNAIDKNYVKYDENDELVLATDSELAKKVLERLKKANIK